MKSLIIEDEFTSRNLLHKMLQEFGECDIAIDGKEAVKAFQSAIDKGEPYKLITLDLIIPKMDGMKTLKQIRKIELEKGVISEDVTKIIIISAKYKKENKEIISYFKEGCEAYLVKPIDKQKLIETLIKLELISKE